MSRETDIKLLMDNWEEKHKNNGYKRFIRDGIVCEEKWEAQHTPRVCYFLKEAYTSNENGYNLVEDLHDCERPWTMWRTFQRSFLFLHSKLFPFSYLETSKTFLHLL